MFERLVKNPVVLAVVAGVIVYAYMAWNKKQEDEKRLKKGKKIREENKYNNIIIPGVTAVIVWFIAYGYFNNVTIGKPVEEVTPTKLINPLQYRVARESPSSSDKRRSFTLVNKTGGISLPTVPDMFLQL
jgi:heme/copper-type cytochrome/quinol oxidase subunit 2